MVNILKPMLAKNWDGRDPTGYYMSEKLDGIRAIWNPEDRTLYSRNGKPFVPPTGWTDDFVYTFLDGELFMGRGKFNECSGQVRRKTNQDWSGIKYRVFDMPHCRDSYLSIYKTLEYLDGYLKNIEIVKQTVCESTEHLLEFEQEILAKGGEGVMLRNPNSLYQQGRRSWDLMKVKRFITDEAIVIGWKGGEGKYTGMIGSLICEWGDQEIEIGTGFTDEQRLNPPIIGSKITFKYFELEDSGKPRFPVFIGVRDYE